MNPRVIVVDDEAASAAVLGGLLRRLGCEVILFDRAAQALPAMLAGDVDLVCLDLSMPGLDGHQALTLIRSHEYSQRAPSVPVIAVTGRVRPQDRAQALAAGFAAHLGKPVLAERLQRVLARTMTLRDDLHRTRYSADRATLEQRLHAMRQADAGDPLPGAAGLALAIEQEGHATLLLALNHAFAGDATAACGTVLAFAGMASDIGAPRLAQALHALHERLCAGPEDELVTAAVLARAELDRVIFTLREQVRTP
ncbi:MAG: response regulator [Rubrivivax sp.]|jgi:CheY-like chemotaxis protein|nr:response regulator [Rubrivivax sp.]